MALGKNKEQLHDREACQMISNFRLLVNTTCIKFNECCKAYPQVNASFYTEISYKGVDRPDELNHKKSEPGRETFPVCLQLGEYHICKAPIGLAGNNRVQTGIYPDSIPNEAESLLCRKHAKINRTC